MSTLFDRRVVLRIGDLEWTDLRVVFSIRRSTRKRPNLARAIRVYGLSRDTVGSAMAPGSLVQLSAGYATTAEVVFTGQLTRAQVLREGPDLVTEITARDGGTAWQASASRVFGGSVTVASAVASLASDMGLAVSASTLGSITGSTRRTVVARGYARDALDDLLRAAGYEWSIQDGALQVLQVGQALANTAVVLSAGTGLVNEPQPMEKGRGWVVQSLMQPKLRPGRVVVLESARASGAYRCTVVEHNGDTHSAQPWTTVAELRPL